MSNFKTIKKDIEVYLEANWSTTVIDYANTRFTQPKTEFLRIRIVHGETEQISMGSSQDHRSVGLIILSLFTKQNEGTGTLLEYADTLTDLFTNKTIGIVNTRSPSVNDVGLSDGHYQINIEIPFWADRVV